MGYPRPYSGASTARLTAMINGDNPRHIQLGVDFTFGVMEDVPVDAAGRNTRIELLSLKPDKYKGNDYVDYRRLPLTVLNKLPEGFIQTVVVMTETFFVHDILSDINAALGLSLDESEVENAQYDTSQVDIPLRIKQDACVAWIDSDFTFKVRYHPPGEEIPLSDLLTVTRLNGLFYPNF